MTNYHRLCAGIFAGAGALVLLVQGHTAEGAIILSSMLAFFIGEKNGEKTTAKSKE